VEEAEGALLVPEPELEPKRAPEGITAEEAPELGEPAALLAELRGVAETTEVEPKPEVRVPLTGDKKPPEGLLLLEETPLEVLLGAEPEELPVTVPVLLPEGLLEMEPEAPELEPEAPELLPEAPELEPEDLELLPEASEMGPAVAEEAAAELELELVELEDLQLKSNRGVVLEGPEVRPKLGLAPASSSMYHQVLVLPSRGQATWSQYCLALAIEATASPS